MNRKLLLLLVTLVMVSCTLLSAVQGTVLAEENKPFTQTSVMDDLLQMSIDGKAFDVANYPQDPDGEPIVLNLIEYCYKENNDVAVKEPYAVYLYIYNPTGVSIKDSQRNKVQVAVTGDAEGNAFSYGKFNIVIVDHSKDSLFYKVRIRFDTSSPLLGYRYDGWRVYSISGIELYTSGANATEYTVGSTWRYTGYSAGCSTTFDTSTLQCACSSLKTISLDVNHTYYRTQTSDHAGLGYQNQINSVYFTIPKRLIDNNGTLHQISAEWYEYVTKDIIVTTQQDVYNYLVSHRGYLCPARPDEYRDGTRNPDVNFSLKVDFQITDMFEGVPGYPRYYWNTDGRVGMDGPRNTTVGMNTAVYYAFLAESIDAYDPSNGIENGGVSSDELIQAIYSYRSGYPNNAQLRGGYWCDGTYVDIKDGQVYNELFLADIDEARKKNDANGTIQRGKCNYVFDIEESFAEIGAWNADDADFFDTVARYGFINAILNRVPKEEQRAIYPIQVVKFSDMVGSDEDVAKRLFVNEHDVPAIRDAYARAHSNVLDEQELVLFRFGATDYLSTPLDITYYKTNSLGQSVKDRTVSGECYRARETVFLDFDVIDLCFGEEHDNLSVIPCVMSPIDVVSDITPPTNIPDSRWWIKVLAIILAVVIIILCWPVLQYIFTALVWVVKQPVKGIKKAVKNSKRKEQ